jgi:hypothetical protein
MLDIERVVTLDDLVDRVPEALIREAEQNRLASEELIDDSHQTPAKERQNRDERSQQSATYSKISRRESRIAESRYRRIA